MESEPIRDRASLLTSARFTPWASTAPLSATRVDEVRLSLPNYAV